MKGLYDTLERAVDKREIDFLITSDAKPWLAVVAKSSDTSVATAFGAFLPRSRFPLGVQIVARPGVWRLHDVGLATVLVASADDVLAYFA